MLKGSLGATEMNDTEFAERMFSGTGDVLQGSQLLHRLEHLFVEIEVDPNPVADPCSSHTYIMPRVGGFLQAEYYGN